MRLPIVAYNDAKVFGKELFSIELRRQFVVLVGLDHIDQPLVERVDSGLILPLALGQHIPALLEQFQAVRLCLVRAWLILPETLVGHLYLLAVTHCIHDDREPLLRRRNLLEENAVTHVLRLVEQVVHRQGLQEPLADAVRFQIIAVGDVISQRPVAFDLNAEGVKNGFPVVVEGPFGQVILPDRVQGAA